MRAEAKIRADLQRLQGSSRLPLLLELSQLQEQSADSGLIETQLEILSFEPQHALTLSSLEQTSPPGSRQEVDKALFLPLLRREDWNAAADRLEHSKADRVEDDKRMAQLRSLGGLGEESFSWMKRALSRGALDPQSMKAALHFARQGEAVLELLSLYGDLLQDPALATEELEREVLQICDQEIERAKPLEKFAQELLSGGAQALGLKLLKRALSLAVQESQGEEEQLEALFSLGELHLQQGEREEAAEALEQIQTIRPDHPRVIQNLRTLFDEAEDWEALLALLEGQLSYTSKESERVALLSEIAQISEERLQAPVRAFSLLTRAFEEIPNRVYWEEHLSRLAEMTHMWSELYELYEHVACAHPQEADQLRRQLATWCEESGDLEEAARQLELLLELDPANDTLLERLLKLTELKGDWQNQVLLLGHRADIALSIQDQRSLLLRKAEILTREGHTEGALETRLKIAEIDEDNLENNLALRDLYRAAGKLDQLVELLQQRENLAEQEEYLELLLELGPLWEESGDLERAIDAYQRVVSLDRTSEPALSALERLYQARERWAALIEVYLIRMELVAPEQQLEIYSQIAQIQEEEFKDSQAAIDAYREMLALAPQDQGALEALERLHRAEEHWDDLADIYTEHLESLYPGEQVTVRQSLAELLRGPLNDLHRAIRTLEPILELFPEEIETLRILGELRAELGEREEAIKLFLREAEAREPSERAGTLKRAIQLCQTPEESEPLWRRVLESDPSDEQALSVLKSAFAKREEWLLFLDFLNSLPSDPPSAALLVEIASLYIEHLGAAEKGLPFLRRALEIDPHEIFSLRQLSSQAIREENNEEACTLLRRLLSLVDDPKELAEIHLKLAKISDDLSLSIEHLRRGYDLDGGSREILLQLASGLFKADYLEEAKGFYEQLLSLEDLKLPVTKIAEIYSDYGYIQSCESDYIAASLSFEYSLEYDAENVEVRKRLVAALRESERWHDVTKHQRIIVNSMENGPEKKRELISLAGLLVDVGDVGEALKLYEEAMFEDGDDLIIINKMMSLIDSQNDKISKIALIRRAIILENDNRKRAQLYYEAGLIQSKFDESDAVKLFDLALDQDPTMLKAFRSLDEILSRNRDHILQGKAYFRMMQRAIENKLGDKVILALSRNLGEINRSYLLDYEEAIRAYNVALKIRPKDIQLHLALAELNEYVENFEEAIVHHRQIINFVPPGIENLHKLKYLFLNIDSLDSSWCISRTLNFLGQSNEEERVFYEQYRGRTAYDSIRSLELDDWINVNHPGKNKNLDRIFMNLYHVIQPLMMDTYRDHRIHKRKSILDLKQESLLGQTLKYISRVIGLDILDCYRGPDGFSGIKIVNFPRPAFLIGTDLLSGKKPAELIFICARSVYMTSQHHFIASLNELYEHRFSRLSLTLASLKKALFPQKRIPGIHKDTLVKGFLRLSDEKKEMLSNLVSKDSLNIKVWLETLTLSADRVGFLLSNDLGACANSIRRSKEDTLSREKRIEALVSFSISAEYFQIRKKIGLLLE